ncbi:hypothetical protein ACIF70_10790 [Actinacidiphila glaucinigra]|uniref:hypothetical protein n=1 Tax=Actinacidiphila glaucinigra TaxID=235986 RepID=UPI0037C7B487
MEHDPKQGRSSSHQGESRADPEVFHRLLILFVGAWWLRSWAFDLEDARAKKADLVGEWRGSGDALLELRSDGIFYASRVPDDDGSALRWTEEPGQGTWYAFDMPGGATEVALTSTDGGAGGFRIAERRGELVLWDTYNDGEMVVLTR